MQNTIGAFLGESENNCIITDTRANLIILRNASGLQVGCHYVLSDFVQGRLVTGTTITLHADNTSEFSEKVSVNTTYDNSGWSGVYDIDSNIVTELHDNRNNVVRDINGTAISNFDWGNTSYSGNTVDTATLTVTYGAVIQVNRNQFLSGSNTNLTGFTGTFNDNIVKTSASLNFSNANGTWRLSEFTDGGSFNASGYTGGGDNYYNHITGASSVNFSNTTSLIIFRQNIIHAAIINNTGITASTFTLNTSNISNTSTITRANSAGNFSATSYISTQGSNINHQTGVMNLINVTNNKSSTIQQLTNAGTLTLTDVLLEQSALINNTSVTTLSVTGTTVTENGNIQNIAGSTIGNLTVNYTKVIGAGSIQKQATATGSMTISNSIVAERSTINQAGATTNTFTRINLYGSNIASQNLSGGTFTMSDTVLESSSSITKLSTSTSGTLQISSSRLTTSGFIQTSGIGNLVVTGGIINGFSGINISSGDRNYNFTRITQYNVSRCNLSGTGVGITDNHNELSMDYRGNYNNSCSGTANTLDYNYISGLSGAMTLSGTTGGLSINRVKLLDGRFTATNNTTTGTYQLITIKDNSIINATNQPTGGVIQYIELGSLSTLTVNKTGVGTLSYIVVNNNATVSITGTTTTISSLNVETGNLNISGGSISNCSKKMNGAWTITGGNQSNTHHWTSVPKTTSVNNTNRADYQGLTPTTPIL